MNNRIEFLEEILPNKKNEIHKIKDAILSNDFHNKNRFKNYGQLKTFIFNNLNVKRMSFFK